MSGEKLPQVSPPPTTTLPDDASSAQRNSTQTRRVKRRYQIPFKIILLGVICSITVLSLFVSLSEEVKTFNYSNINKKYDDDETISVDDQNKLKISENEGDVISNDRVSNRVKENVEKQEKPHSQLKKKEKIENKLLDNEHSVRIQDKEPNKTNTISIQDKEESQQHIKESKGNNKNKHPMKHTDSKPTSTFDYFSFNTMEQPSHTRNNFMTPDASVDLSPHENYNYPPDPTREDDKDCIFLNSSIYRSVYVYPTWNNETDGWHGPILNTMNKNLTEWPWLDIDKRAREGGWGHYGDASNQMGQYTLELIVRDLMTHPESCLRTMDPMKATLFYVPYLPSTEFHNGKTFVSSKTQSPYEKAIESATSGKYDEWEHYFGLTSDFWKRRGGADHILVFSEPLHGLSHPRNRRGSYHFIHTQKMLTPPIIVSIEVSTSFVSRYPKCSAKNIVTPYPNPDGNWINGIFDDNGEQIATSVLQHNAVLQLEADLLSANSAKQDIFHRARPVAQYYKAGMHGSCRDLRKNMKADYECTASSKAFSGDLKMPYHYGMRVSTFCPCPGGDSPSAKRMFDAVNAGCIPVILSYDYVWPFTKEADPAIPIDPASFSLRFNTADFRDAKHGSNCKLIDESENAKPSVQGAIEKIDASDIAQLREGMKEASSKLYSYWSKEGYGGSEYPLRDGIFPNGGASIALVKLLGERAGGSRWPECKVEAEGRVEGQDPMDFVC